MAIRTSLIRRCAMVSVALLVPSGCSQTAEPTPQPPEPWVVTAEPASAGDPAETALRCNPAGEQCEPLQPGAEVEAPALRKRPSDYVRSGRIYFSCEADEWLLPQALRLVGEDQIVYASDFPHWDHSFPGSIDEIRDRGDLTDAQKRKVLADNCRRLYKL